MAAKKIKMVASTGHGKTIGPKAKSEFVEVCITANARVSFNQHVQILRSEWNKLQDALKREKSPGKFGTVLLARFQEPSHPLSKERVSIDEYLVDLADRKLDINDFEFEGWGGDGDDLFEDVDVQEVKVKGKKK